MNELKKVFSESLKNASGDYSNTKIGRMLALLFFLIKMSFVQEITFSHYQVEFAVVVLALTGGVKLLEGYADKLRGAGIIK